MKNIKKNIRHFFLLSGLTVGCIYGINKFIEFTSGIKNLLNKKDSRFFEWRYGNIFYTKQGKGSPLLLIHDLHPASSSIEWDNIIKNLSKDHTVYALDLLGCGRSDKPNFTYTNYMYVQLITDFIKKIIEQKTDILATGDSCSFVLMTANMEHDIMNRIFLVSPPSLESLLANPNRKNNILKKILELPVIGTFVYNLQMRGDKITKLFEESYFYKNTFISGKLKDAYYESAHEKNSKGRFLSGSIIGNYTNINVIPSLKKITNPIYIIGSRETNTSIRNMDSYVSYDENIETAYISNCSKLPQLEQPDKFCKIIHMFYES